MPHSPPPPDEPSPRRDDPGPALGPRAGRRGGPGSASSDEIRAFLTSSSRGQGSEPKSDGSHVGFWGVVDVEAPLAENAALPTSLGSGLDVTMKVDLAATAGRGSGVVGPVAPPRDWGGLLLRSYASAVTLGLGWLLWSGRAASPPVPSREATPTRRRLAEPARPSVAAVAPAAPRVPTTTLGKPIRVGDLEVTPLLVLRRSVRVARNLGEEMLVQEHSDCLALTIRVTNQATSGDAVRPIVAADLADGDGFAIDVPSGPRIAMFALAPGGDWAVEDQSFPEAAPGETVDVVLLSEPLGDRRLPPGMTWRFRVATDPARMSHEALGVTFGPNDLP